MNSRWFCALALVLLACTAVSGESPRIFPYQVHTESLDNGLEVIVVPMSSAGLVAYWSIVRTGSRDEFEPGHTGFAHFFEHMMFRGTERFPSEVYNQHLTEMGADANAYTTDDLTAYHLAVSSEDLERVVELESDRFRNLAYAKTDFETEAGAVYGEYRKNRMSPFFALFEAVQATAYKKHTYGHTTMGYEKDIKAMPGMYDYSLGFFKRYYRPDNVVLLVVGDVEVDSTMDLVREYYGTWKAGYVTPRIEAEPAQREERRVEVAYDGQSLPIVWVAYKAGRFEPSNREYLAGRLLADLAFGETSEIYKKLVLDEQVVEFVTADLDPNRDPGLFNVYARVKDPAQVDYVMSAIDAVVERSVERPPDAERLEDLKSRLKYGFLMRLDTPDRVASSLARRIAITGGIEFVDEMFLTIEKVTPADIQSAAKQLFNERSRSIGVLRGRS